jgi:hypothetical protein
MTPCPLPPGLCPLCTLAARPLNASPDRSSPFAPIRGMGEKPFEGYSLSQIRSSGRLRVFACPKCARSRKMLRKARNPGRPRRDPKKAPKIPEWNAGDPSLRCLLMPFSHIIGYVFRKGQYKRIVKIIDDSDSDPQIVLTLLRARWGGVESASSVPGSQWERPTFSDPSNDPSHRAKLVLPAMISSGVTGTRSKTCPSATHPPTSPSELALARHTVRY